MKKRRTNFAMIIEALLAANTASTKVDVLLKYDKSKLLKRIISLAYHPLKKFRLDNYKTRHESMGKEGGMCISKYVHILDDILHDKLSPSDARYACDLAMININSDNEAMLFYGIVKETDPLNLTVDIINKAWPNFIPVYPLSKPSEEFSDGFIWPAVAQRCVGGVRVNVTVYNGIVEFRLSNGDLIHGFELCAIQFINLAHQSNIVYDGVAILVENEVQVKAALEDILSADPANVRFVLWDSLRYDYGYINGEDNRIGYNWRFNGLEHMMILAQPLNPKPCYQLPEYQMVSNVDEASVYSNDLGTDIIVKSLSGTWHAGADGNQVRIRV
jgi:hypothetical protein